MTYSDKLSLEIMLLGYLYKQPKHGYDLIKEYKEDQAAQLLWQAKPGKIYFWLKKFEEIGWIEGKHIPGSTRPNRLEYKLTREGRKNFNNWLAAPVEKPRYMRMELLAKIHFALKLEPSLADSILEKQRGVCRQWLETIEDQSLEIEDDFIPSQIMNYRIKQISSMISWIDECRESLLVLVN